MKYCLCMYDLNGDLIGTRLWSCMGCGWKHAPKDTPACMRKRSRDGDIVRCNPSFTALLKEKRIK